MTFLAQQRILSFSCFQTLSVFKGIWRFPVSKHFPYSRDFVFFPVSRHFPYSRDFVVSLFLDTFPFQKGLETGKNNYFQGILSFLLFLDTFCIQKCLETEKQPNKCTLPTRGVRSVPVQSVLSRRSH